ncbi:chorismate mutase [Clostridiales bacterium oral taxon 876 str. F0540]|nr:chorismate mutase [Clostridiales bacterium oral taxon 876 str. F0540]
MIAIRGATTIESNSSDNIRNASIELFEKIIENNNLELEDIVMILFSCTDDITKDYPGKFLREHFDIKDKAIMHFNEMKVENSLKLCIRISLLCEHVDNKEIKFVYLNKARELRKDLMDIT